MKNYQTDTLIELKKYFKNIEKKYKGNLNATSKFYPVSATSSIGLNFLKTFIPKKKINLREKLLINLKDIFYSLNYFNYKIIHNTKNYYYDKIIFTWANNNNFKKNGSIYDPYFNTNSSDLKKTLWFVIFSGTKKPKIIKKNIVLFSPRTKKSINLFILFKFILKKIPLLFKNKNIFFASISNHVFFADILLKNANVFLNNRVKKIFMPYEGQPFQTTLISKIKKNYKFAKVIGYIHNPPLALPSNLIYRKCCPHKLILNGKDQKYCFTKFLGWKKKNLIYLPSFRFRKNNQKLRNLIFFPLLIKNKKNVLKNLKYLHFEKIINLRNYKIRVHPTNLNSIKVKKIVSTFYNSFKNVSETNLISKNRFLIYIGNSGAAIESIERGNKVIHITDDNDLDMYSTILWPNLKVTKINENIYIYESIKKNQLIHIGSKKSSLKNYYNSNIFEFKI